VNVIVVRPEEHAARALDEPLSTIAQAAASAHEKVRATLVVGTMDARQLISLLRGNESGELTLLKSQIGPKRTRAPTPDFGHLDHLLSGDQHVRNDLGQAAQIPYPSSDPMTLSADTS
jgi:hypothetical protein